jgi:phosphate starvation-inducible protein PhoH
LQGIDDIRFVAFTETDVARHRLVQNIIAAYESDTSRTEVKEKEPEKPES